MQEKKSPSLSLQLAVLTFARLFLNTGLRMAYPFLPAFSRGLGLPLEQTTQLFNARNVSGFIAPVLGSLSEKYGRRPVMVVAMVISITLLPLILIKQTQKLLTNQFL